MRRRIEVLEVTATLVRYAIQVFTPGAGWDGDTVQCTRAAWEGKHRCRPYKGLTIAITI